MHIYFIHSGHISSIHCCSQAGKCVFVNVNHCSLIEQTKWCHCVAHNASNQHTLCQVRGSSWRFFELARRVTTRTSNSNRVVLSVAWRSAARVPTWHWKVDRSMFERQWECSVTFRRKPLQWKEQFCSRCRPQSLTKVSSSTRWSSFDWYDGAWPC